jgi:hypothetical protein
MISMANGFLQVDADAGIHRWSFRDEDVYEPFRMVRHDEDDESYLDSHYIHMYSKIHRVFIVFHRPRITTLLGFSAATRRL